MMEKIEFKVVKAPTPTDLDKELDEIEKKYRVIRVTKQDPMDILDDGPYWACVTVGIPLDDTGQPGPS